MRHNRQPTGKQIATRLEEAEKVFELLKQGFSYRQVARELGVSLHVVQDRIAAYRSEVATQAEELREIQHARIQAGIQANWKAYLAGDKDAAATIIRLMEREARLMGLDSATAFKIEAKTVDHQTQAQEFLERMLAAKTIQGEVIRER